MTPGPATAGSGGAGGGGAGATDLGTGTAGTANTGGGGGAGGAAGGSGVVVVRFPGTTCAAVAPGTNSLSTLPAPAGGCKVARFTVTGTLTIS